ncbi:hypothetical protein SAMN04489729_3358 [Amycolatopsis lurida]|uniref:Uncharacterized protein n=1 Tax=Amycolatopsis lurida NRRL 2430 TaxID=1460371 RepID=A0A2P2FRL8_AMYLU|nr:hypothetical protein [Amycolatopsis lurida]KFU79356.1 hypothetical protein BB31_20770 [Amycolatopsis lurida NRRL 2430]SED09890.1 hypothetical protein SAMN04489729_3358 [Amycolatopsis lurida]
MPDNELPGFLIIGLIFVIADGQVLYRGARRYLTAPDAREGSGSVAWMVVTVFHLAAIGMLALLAVVAPEWSGSAAAFVGRLGVFLLLMAVAHVLTLSVLGHRRQDHVVETRLRKREEDRVDSLQEPTVTPVPGQDGRNPRVSPDLGDRGPYQA